MAIEARIDFYMTLMNYHAHNVSYIFMVYFMAVLLCKTITKC